MATIIQDYGPIYGEVVNGTVQGRPNGSVYVPISNTIEISFLSDTPRLILSGTYYVVVGDVQLVANSQDLSSHMTISIFTDEELTTQLGTSRSLPAGNFNGHWGNVSSGSTALIPGETYYLVAQLVNNGTPVATSNVISVVKES